MAKKRRGFSRGAGLGGAKNIVKLIAVGAGAALLAGAIAPRVAPSIDPKLAAAAGGFLLGGPMVAIAAYATPMILGAISGTGATSTGTATVYG